MANWAFQPLLPATAQSSITGGIKVWDGSTWTWKPISYWNGSIWVVKPLKYWTGAVWRETNT